MADWISSFVPECETYVEVFGGAYWVYVNSNIHERCEKAIYNDFNPYMTNLFLCTSKPETFSNFIDSEKLPLQTKGIPVLSKKCKKYFRTCKENDEGGLFHPEKEIRALKEKLDNDSDLDDKPISCSIKEIKEKIKKLEEDSEKTKEQKEEIKKSLRSRLPKLYEQRREIRKKRAKVRKKYNSAKADRQSYNNELRDEFGEEIEISGKNMMAALQYAYILTCSFSGIDPVDSDFQDYKGKYGSKFKAFYNRLTSDKFIPKLKKIKNCENMSFEKVIKEYDSPNTYFYCDPPYWSTELYYSFDRFGRDQHEELKDCLHNIEGKFALSYYDFFELSDMYPKDRFRWERREFVKPAGAKGGMKQSKGEEVLIMNYEEQLDKTE